MIIVMDCGYATRPGDPPVATQSGRPPAPKNYFPDVLVQELIPVIDAAYRTMADREHRATAGLSMGAGRTLQITLSNLDKFSYIGSFSGGALQNFDLKMSYNGVFADPAAFNKKVHLLWLGAGTAEESHVAGSKAAHEALDKARLKNVLFLSPGTAHEWQTWRRDLPDFPGFINTLRREAGLQNFSCGQASQTLDPPFAGGKADDRRDVQRQYNPNCRLPTWERREAFTSE